MAVRKAGGLLVSINSQAPNKAVREHLDGLNFDELVPEYRFGDSRIDFFMRKGDKSYLMEVKGCTLEIDGVGYFPDGRDKRGKG